MYTLNLKELKLKPVITEEKTFSGEDKFKIISDAVDYIEAQYEAELTDEEKKKGMTRAKKAVQEVILPKIPMGEERTYLTTLIAEL